MLNFLLESSVDQQIPLPIVGRPVKWGPAPLGCKRPAAIHSIHPRQPAEDELTLSSRHPTGTSNTVGLLRSITPL